MYERTPEEVQLYSKANLRASINTVMVVINMQKKLKILIYSKPTWCVISGLASAISLPVLARMPWWSSQFNKVYFTSPSPFLFLPLLLLPPPDIRYVSKHACSRMTYRRRVDVAIPPRWTWACAGIMAGLEMVGMGVWGFRGVVNWNILLRNFEAGSGRVGLSVDIKLRESIDADLPSVEGSTCIPWLDLISSICGSSAFREGLRWRLRWWGLSPDVDFGRGGRTMDGEVLESGLRRRSYRWSLLSTEPEWRRRRVGMVLSPTMECRQTTGLLPSQIWA